MKEHRELLTFEVPFEEFEDFLDNNRPLIVNEVVSAVEDMMYNDLDVIDVCTIKVILPIGGTIMGCKLKRDDVEEGLQKLLDWTIEVEEYELSHRIKLIQDWINENGIRPKTKRRTRKARKGNSGKEV
jgi:hypothetical protein